MAKEKEGVDPLESFVLRWMHSGPLPYEKNLQASENASAVASLVGVTARWSLAFWLMLAALVQSRTYLRLPLEQGDMALLLLFAPFVFATFGACGLAWIRSGISMPVGLTRLSLMVCLPISLVPCALPFPILNGFAFGYLAGLSAMAMEHRWGAMKASGQEDAARWELVLTVLGSLAAFMFALGTSHLLTGTLGIAGAVASCAFMCVVLLLSRYSFLKMLEFLCAIRDKDDGDGARSAMIVLCCILMWPVWVIDRSGYIITGGFPTR